MTPFSPGQDVFQTQADQRFNSFSSPMNPMNQNSGDWGMNSNYMTPSYTSPYRPRYTGPNGAQNSGYKPGFGRSLNHVFNPFEGGGTNYGGNTYGQNSSYYDQIGMRPIDAGMGMMQSLAIPIAISMGSFKAFTGMGTAMGRNFGAGLGGALGKGFGTAAAGNMAAGLGAVGGFAGGMLIPMAIAQGVTSAVDKTIFEPYVAQRQTADALRRNTFGMSYGEGLGNGITGGGMSRRTAVSQAGDISRMAARDVTFNQMEVSQLTDYAGRSGMLDNTAGSHMASRMKEITRQVKTVMAVANTSDFREAIEIMAKLQTSGVGSQRLSGTMGAIGGLASAAGMSTQRLMNTVGAQGQYLYGANGLTPYVGQLTAGAAAASFGSAYRSGLMSPALMSRMGGVEGASQSANAGLLGALQSPYTTIMGMNAMHGGSPGSIVGNMSMFGGHASRNAAENIGMMNLMAPSLTSNMAETQGLNQVNRMLRQLGANSPGMMKNGKMGAGSAYSLLTQTLGIGDTEVRAMLEQMRANQDPNTMKSHNAGFDRAEKDFMLKFADQNSMNKGVFTRPYNHFMNNMRGIQEYTAGFGEAVAYTGAAVGDKIENFMYGGLYGHSGGAINGDSFNKRTNSLEFKDVSNPNTSMIADHISVSKINSKIKEGDEDAIGLVNASSKNEKIRYIKKLVDKGTLPKIFGEEDSAVRLIASLDKGGTSKVKYTPKDAAGRIREAYKNSTGNTDVFNGSEKLYLAAKLNKNPDDIASMEKLSQITYGDKNKINAMNLEGELFNLDKFSAIYGTRNGGEIYKAMSEESGMDSNGMRWLVGQKGGLDKLSKKLGIKGAKSSEELMTKYADKMGLNIIEKSLDASKAGAITHDAAIAFNQTMEGISKERSKLDRQYQGGVVDFTQYTSGVNALDNQDTTLKFGSAVDRFGIYVEAIVTGKLVSVVTTNIDEANKKIKAGV